MPFNWFAIGEPITQLENKIEEGVEIGEKTLLCINRPIESADLRIEDFVGISFTHHMEILHKTTTLDGDVVLFILLYTKDNSYFCKRYFKKRRIWT